MTTLLMKPNIQIRINKQILLVKLDLIRSNFVGLLQ